MKTFSDLKRNLKKDFSTFKLIKVAVLGDTATQFITQAIKGAGFEFGYHLDIWEADFNQVERQVFDPASELHEFEADIIIVFHSSHKLLGKYNQFKTDHAWFAADELSRIQSIHNALTAANTKSKTIYYNYTEIDDSVFGNYANKVSTSFLFQLRKLNLQLMEYAASTPNFYLCDISAIQNQVGKAAFFQSSVYINTEMVLSI